MSAILSFLKLQDIYIYIDIYIKASLFFFAKANLYKERKPEHKLMHLLM